MSVETDIIAGERLAVDERVIVSPATGRFGSAPPEVVTAEGELIMEGQTIGVVEGPGVSVAVRSPFRGFLMQMVAADGQRVDEGQRIAWLRSV